MAKVLTGVLVKAGQGRIRRGSIEVPDLVFQLADGTSLAWKSMSMDREVADALRLHTPCTLYLTTTWTTIYGVRPVGGEGVFHCSQANPLFLLMAIGMLFMGLCAAMLVAPLLLALAGAAGICVYFDASSAKSRFWRDSRLASPLAVATPLAGR